MDVQLPDGTLLKDVPDGMSKADLTAKLKSNGYDVSKLEPSSAPGMLDKIKTQFTNSFNGTGQTLKDIGGAVADGSGQIGSTLMAPVDAGARALGVDPNSTLGSFVGRTDRRQAMQSEIKDLGANPDSPIYKGVKLGTEVAGTLGVGGAIAAPVRALSPMLAPLADALATSGMRAGGVANPAANIAVRSAGGAVSGGAAAGLVDPSQAGTGAAIGGVLPPVLQGLGKAAGGIAGIITGPAVPDSVRSGVAAAQGAGYVIPPTQASPTLVNRLVEGAAGKISTAQNASAKNQEVTNGLVKQALGIAPDVQLSPSVLTGVRKQAAQAYDAVSSTGTITPGPNYDAALDAITANAKQAAAGFPNAKPNPLIAEIDALRSPQFDASSAVSKIRSLRADADTAYAGGNKELGAALKSGASALEDAIEAHLQTIHEPDLSVIRPALKGDDGKIYYGNPRQTHIGMRVQMEGNPKIIESGFAAPDGTFLSRDEAGRLTGMDGPLDAATYARSIGYPTKPTEVPADLLQNFRDARQLIAKTYTAQNALNVTSGNIQGNKLAAMLQRGKPLSGDIRTAAEFASQFPKAAQSVDAMGSLPQISPLDIFGAISAHGAGAGVGGALGGPIGAMVGAGAVTAAQLAARPALRSLALSPYVQNRLLSSVAARSSAAPNDLALLLAHRAAPPLLSDR